MVFSGGAGGGGAASGAGGAAGAEGAAGSGGATRAQSNHIRIGIFQKALLAWDRSMDFIGYCRPTFFQNAGFSPLFLSQFGISTPVAWNGLHRLSCPKSVRNAGLPSSFRANYWISFTVSMGQNNGLHWPSRPTIVQNKRSPSQFRPNFGISRTGSMQQIDGLNWPSHPKIV